MKKHALISIAVCAAFAAPFAATAQQHLPEAAPAAAAPAVQPMSMLATQLIGKNVVDPRGQGLGEVQDLAVDIRHNRVHYAMLDLQGKMFAYPVSSLGFDPERNAVVLAVSEPRLERAKGTAASAYERRTDGTTPHGLPVGGRYDDSPAKPSGEPMVRVMPRDGMQLIWASKLIGWNIDDRDGQGIGEIEDLVIDPSTGDVRFAAVDFDDNIGGAEAKPWNDLLHPLPLTAFATRDDGDDLVLNADRAKLNAAAGFTTDQLARGLRDRTFLAGAQRYADQL